MIAARLPHDEARRLQAIRALYILDTPPEEAFDDIVRIASELCGVPISLVTVLDEKRQWFKARIGLAASETPREVSFCGHAILEDELFVVPDTHDDARFSDNPLVTGAPNIRFYAGAPVKLPAGEAVGTLCIIDHVPHVLTTTMRLALLSLRRQVEAHLALRLRVAELAEANEALRHLQEEKARLTQFLVHDMRNGLGTIALNAGILPAGQDEISECAEEIYEGAMALDRLVLDIIDVGRLEAGVALEARKEPVMVASVFADVARAFARRAITSDVAIVNIAAAVEVHADGELVRRIVRNFVENALRHAPPGSTVTMDAFAEPERTVLRVVDAGPGVPEEAREKIFELYVQGTPDGRGRGIGLAFCRAAASAQGAEVWVESSDAGGATFCVSFPR